MSVAVVANTKSS